MSNERVAFKAKFRKTTDVREILERNSFTNAITEQMWRGFQAGAEWQRSQQSAPAGYVMVPVDMTQEMYLVFCEERGKHGGTFRSAYKAMLAAAPKAETVHDQQADRIADLERLLLDSRGFVEAYVKNTFFGPNARGHLIKIDAALKGTTV